MYLHFQNTWRYDCDHGSGGSRNGCCGFEETYYPLLRHIVRLKWIFYAEEYYSLGHGRAS